MIRATIDTNDGAIGLELDNAKDAVHRQQLHEPGQAGVLRQHDVPSADHQPGLGALQCGDPSGTGNGGPGYRFPNEYPTNQYRLNDPAMRTPVLYPRGTLAMANSGPGTNGSQFFLVYEDSLLPPTYTVFGTIDATGLAVLEKIAAAGVEGGGGDGKPAEDVTIESVRVG